MSTLGKTYKKASHKDVYQIAQILEFEALASHDGERATYKPGWSDQKVVEYYGNPNLSLSHIIGIRSNIFGKLIASSPPKTLERQIAEMQDKLAKLQSKVAGK